MENEHQPSRDLTERICQALREVKLMREGKIKELSMDELCQTIYTPNDVTIAAMKEAQSGKPLEELDVDHFHCFMAGLL